MEKATMTVKAIPEGYHSVTPILVVKNAPGLIDFLKQAFDGKEKYRMKSPDGTIMHAEVAVGDSAIMLSEATDQHSPVQSGIYLYVNDADTTYNKALKAGGISVMPLEDQFWGDRSGCVKDPTGNNWWIATHIEDLDPQEMQTREKEYMKQKH
ncbi:MAG TPA: VOC family protein [Cytophagaceae bacterium]|jgi:PhnB protein|nr:VOC family protein [Cytophagaceae bacterium]